MSDYPNDFDLDELSRLHEAATPGELYASGQWVCFLHKGCTHGCPPEYGHEPGCGLEPLFDVGNPADAALIAAMRNALPKLIERVKVAEAERDEERRQVVLWKHNYGLSFSTNLLELVQAENARLTTELAEAKADDASATVERDQLRIDLTNAEALLHDLNTEKDQSIAELAAEVKRLTDGITALLNRYSQLRRVYKGNEQAQIEATQSELRALLAKDGA